MQRWYQYTDQFLCIDLKWGWEQIWCCVYFSFILLKAYCLPHNWCKTRAAAVFLQQGLKSYQLPTNASLPTSTILKKKEHFKLSHYPRFHRRPNWSAEPRRRLQTLTLSHSTFHWCAAFQHFTAKHKTRAKHKTTSTAPCDVLVRTSLMLSRHFPWQTKGSWYVVYITWCRMSLHLQMVKQ